MNDVIEFIKQLNIDKSRYIVIACSGGPDSMFLLELLNSMNYKCVCAHVNHNHREVSKEEYVFVNNYCNKNNIVFEGTEIKKYLEEDTFTENDARLFRYDFFESIMRKYNAQYLFTAHHGDDLIETVLMRMVRGSTLRGYGGFDSVVDKGEYKIARPLVYLTKYEIEKYNREHNIEYCIDESNNDDDYTRNRYRHVVLPFLKEEDKNVHLKFLKFSETLKEYSAYVGLMADEKYNEIFKYKKLNITEFNKCHSVIKKEILNRIFHEIYQNDLLIINDRHVSNLLDVINSEKPNVTMLLPNNIKAVKKYNIIDFNQNDLDFDDYLYELQSEVITPLGVIKTIDDDNSKSNYVLRLNTKDIVLPIVIRNRRNGDKMKVKNLNGSKKIKEIFIEEKIVEEKRNVWPIVTDSNNEILWIPGLKKSQFDIPIDQDYDIILEYEKGEID